MRQFLCNICKGNLLSDFVPGTCYEGAIKGRKEPNKRYWQIEVLVWQKD